MPTGLLERLGARVTFVVGKGGVGKTTTAGGLALALADGGTPTHLLSTDPAHSLGDLFQRALGPEPAPSPCTPQLVLEELDAAAVAESRMGALSPGLRELIDRGTYLDIEDADALLSASVPGLDEIGAALRIAELTGSRLVVDTAPTGHTLRLLDTPGVVRSWVRVFDAMAEKAHAVTAALVHRHLRLPVEEALEQLAADMAAFEEITAGADFLVVTGGGAVVRAETHRLVAELEGRVLRVAGTVGHRAPEGDDVEADFLLPRHPELAGCAALREWWPAPAAEAADREMTTTPPAEAPPASPADRPGTGRAGAAAEASAPGGWPPDPLDRELVVFTGKGGVGKSTCAAATAVRLADAARPVVLMGVDPAGSLEDVLGPDPVPGLTVRQTDGEGELERLRSLYHDEVERIFAAVGLDRAARLDRAVIESLWRLAPPGLDEVMGVTRLAAELEAGTRVVLDTAPTGHFLRLMAMPELALDWVRRIMRILLKYGAAGELDAPAAELLRFARRFRTLRERLVDGERTAIVVVMMEEPLVRAETERLVDRVRMLRLPLAAVIVNRSTVAAPPPFDAPAWRAPDVVEPTGAAALEEFTRSWERIA